MKTTEKSELPVSAGESSWVGSAVKFLIARPGSAFRAVCMGIVNILKRFFDLGSIKTGRGRNTVEIDQFFLEEDPELAKVCESLAESNGTIIFYGTNSGTAKKYSVILAYKLSGALLESEICDPSEYNMLALFKLIKLYGNKITVGFIVASYGEGGPTDNFSQIFESVVGLDAVNISDSPDKPELKKLPLSDLRYYIFGLGNSSYQNYNGASITLDQNLTRLGARRIGNFVLGDECNNQEEAFNAWQEEIVKFIVKEAGYNVDSDDYKSKYRSLPYISPFTVKTQPELSNNSKVPVFKGCFDDSTKRIWEWTDKSKNFNLPSYVEIPFLKRIFLPSRDRPYYVRVVSSKLMFNEVYDEFTFQDKSLSWGFPNLDSLPCKAQFNDYVFRVERNCVHIDLDITGVSNIENYHVPGGHVHVIPRNNPLEVERLVEALNWNDEVLNTPIKLFTKTDAHFCTRKPAVSGLFAPLVGFKYYYDITAVVTQKKLDVLARLANDKSVSNILFELASNREMYKKYVLLPKKNLSDILLEIKPPINLTPDVVFGDLLDLIESRRYSIASACTENMYLMSIVAVIVRYCTECPTIPLNNEKTSSYIRGREGFATSWFQRSHVNNEFEVVKSSDTLKGGLFPEMYVPIYFGAASLSLPAKMKTPIIMVGPGTGVAPFRAFIRERLAQAMNKKQVGTTILFYGCRSENSHLYKDEFEEIMRTKPENFDLRTYTAYSRAPNKSKVYVNDLILENKNTVWNILENQKGIIYVCGDSSTIGQSIKVTMQSIYDEFSVSKKTDAPTSNYLSILSKEKRFFEELW